DKGEHLTVAFTDVFQTFEPHASEFEELKKPVQTAKIPLDKIDYTWIEQALKRQMIPVEKVLTHTNKDHIAQVMHLYEHDLYKVKYNDVTIELTNKPQIETKPKSSERSEPKTKEDHLAEALETMSPKDLLEDLSSGGHASESDMKLIREVMLKQGLKTPVM